MTPLLKAEVFEFYVREMAKELRGWFEQADLSRLHFETRVSGQTLTGDLLVEFKISDGEWADSVKGGSVQAVLEEFMRRRGWVAQNAALCLPRVDPDHTNDELAAKLDDKTPQP
jgi:hypothetical protein